MPAFLASFCLRASCQSATKLSIIFCSVLLGAGAVSGNTLPCVFAPAGVGSLAGLTCAGCAGACAACCCGLVAGLSLVLAGWALVAPGFVLGAIYGFWVFMYTMSLVRTMGLPLMNTLLLWRMLWLILTFTPVTTPPLVPGSSPLTLST